MRIVVAPEGTKVAEFGIRPVYQSEQEIRRRDMGRTTEWIVAAQVRLARRAHLTQGGSGFAKVEDGYYYAPRGDDSPGGT